MSSSSAFHVALEWVAETFYTHSRINGIYVCLIQILVCTVLLPVIRLPLLKLWSLAKQHAINQQQFATEEDAITKSAVATTTTTTTTESDEEATTADDDADADDKPSVDHTTVDALSKTDDTPATAIVEPNTVVAEETTEETERATATAATATATAVTAVKETAAAVAAEQQTEEDEDDEEDEPQVSRSQWWVNILYTVWTGTVIFFLVPYTMIKGSTSWLCYWAYTGQVAFFAGTLLCDQCGYTNLKKYIYQIMLPMLHSTMLVANGLYTYYGLWQWLGSYVFSHCVPPLVLYGYICYHADFLTEDVLPLDTWFASWLWVSLGSVELVFYRLSYTPAWIYELQRMEYMYEVATILPVLGNGVLLAMMCVARYVWLKRQKKQKTVSAVAVAAVVTVTEDVAIRKKNQ